MGIGKGELEEGAWNRELGEVMRIKGGEGLGGDGANWYVTCLLIGMSVCVC